MKILYLFFFAVAFICSVSGCQSSDRSSSSNDSSITKSMDVQKTKDSVDAETGLVFDARFNIVRATCTACHSADLVTQNRADREGWKEMIRWMQASQGLWDLGDNEGLILDYLAEHYGIEEIVGRRAALDLSEIEWYDLNPEDR